MSTGRQRGLAIEAVGEMVGVVDKDFQPGGPLLLVFQNDECSGH